MSIANQFSQIQINKINNINSPIIFHNISDKAGLTMQKKYFNCLCVYGQIVYVGTRNSKLYVFTFNGQKIIDQKVVIPHCEIVSSITATHKYFVSVPQSDDQTVVSIWQTSSKVFLTALKGHKSQVSKVIFLKDDGYLATSSWDSTVKVWYIDQNLTNQQSYRNFSAGSYPILALEQDKKTDILILGGDDCYLTFWNWKKDQTVGKIFGHAGSVTFLYSFSPFILTAGGDNKFKIINYIKQQIVQQQIIMIEDNNNNQKNKYKQKYQFKILSEIKKQYDSILYSTLLDNDNLLLIDRQGYMFIYNKYSDQSIKIAGNQFNYNESITGLQRFGKFLFIATTKGSIKVFTYDLLQN